MGVGAEIGAGVCSGVEVAVAVAAREAARERRPVRPSYRGVDGEAHGYENEATALLTEVASVSSVFPVPPSSSSLCAPPTATAPVAALYAGAGAVLTRSTLYYI